jgi:Ca-activated chloride channel family protein
VRLSYLLLVGLLAGGNAFAQVSEQPLSRLPGSELGPGSAAQPPAHDDIPAATFRSATDLVAFNVVVTDGKQNFVSGLTADNFAVFEDGIRQEVAFFAAGEVPLDLAILLDTSASMTDKLPTAQQAAIGFASTLREQDRLLVVDIKDTTKVIAPLDTDLESATKAILATSARGGTGLYNGLYLTLKELAKGRRGAGDVRRQALVVLSDGDDTASLMAFDDVMQLAKESGISIYTITLKSKWVTRQVPLSSQKGFSQADYSMKALAQETGGRSFFPLEITELADVYTLIADELASQYALGYTSKNPKRDGSYRRVIVRVTDRPGMQTRARSGYLSARAAAVSK